MIRLSVAPKLVDFVRQVYGTIDAWFIEVTSRFGIYSKSGVPLVSEVPENQWGLFKDTSSGDVGLYVNDQGVLKTLASTATAPSSGGPAFSCLTSVAQLIPASTFTKVSFPSEEYDTDGAFASSRFTPQEEGIYLITGGVHYFTSASLNSLVVIRKNGTTDYYGVQLDSAGFMYTVAYQIYMNGTTDYVELWTLTQTSRNTEHARFQGSLIRPGPV